MGESSSLLSWRSVRMDSRMIKVLESIRSVLLLNGCEYIELEIDNLFRKSMVHLETVDYDFKFNTVKQGYFNSNIKLSNETYDMLQSLFKNLKETRTIFKYQLLELLMFIIVTELLQENLRDLIKCEWRVEIIS